MSLAPIEPAVASPEPQAERGATVVLDALRQWSEEGWIRRLDRAFGDFMVDLCPQASPTLILAAALLAHVEGRGQTCLQIDELVDDPDKLLGWPAEASVALHELMSTLPQGAQEWLGDLAASVVVDAHGATTGCSEPLVLRGSRLYLRRFWGYEQQVAAHLVQRGCVRAPVDEAAARRWLDLLFASPTDTAGAAPASPPADEAAAVDWQRIACGIALRGRVSVITGGPGTGKTYCAARLLALLFALDPEPHKLRVALAAPTGKAAARLKHSIEASLAELQRRLGDTLPLQELAVQVGAARTLHALLGASQESRSFRFDAARPLEVDVLFVDEASMVHLEMMAALLDALPAQARVVFLGDKDQLASVEAGAVLGDLCQGVHDGRYDVDTVRFVQAVTGERIPGQLSAGEGAAAGPAFSQQIVMLRQSRRFSGPIGELALAVNLGDAKAALGMLAAPSVVKAGSVAGIGGLSAPPVQWMQAGSAAAVVRLAVDGRAGPQGRGDGYRPYLEAVRRRPEAVDAQAHRAWVQDVLSAFERFRVLCAVREGEWGVADLNAAIERSLAAEGLLTKRGEWYEGRPVMVTRNDYRAGVFNGDIGIALRSASADSGIAGALRLYLADGSALRSVSVGRVADAQTAFAMTVHKSQGSEFDHTVLVLPAEGSRLLTRELVYTGITRARSVFTLVMHNAAAFTKALGQPTRRSSGLPELLRGGTPHTTCRS